MAVEHLDLLGVETGQQAVLLDLACHLVAEGVVPSAHHHLVALNAQPVVLVEGGHAVAPGDAHGCVVEELTALAYLEREDVAVLNVVAHVAVDFYAVVHNQLIL